MEQEKRCCLCNRPKEEVPLLIQGELGLCVCNECIRLFSDLLDQYSRPNPRPATKMHAPIRKPHEIKEILDRTIVGQDTAKIALSGCGLQP